MAGAAFGARSILRNQAALKKGLEKIPVVRYHLVYSLLMDIDDK